VEGITPWRANPMNATHREMMSIGIEVVDRNDNLRDVEEGMATKQLRHLPVLEQGEIVGIVTRCVRR
jgi:CBS domain-containing protein